MDIPLHVRKTERGMAEQITCACLFYPPFLLLSAVWLFFILAGTLFYTYHEDYGWAKGSYYAVNVGFNIGWNWTLVESEESEIFSVFYLVAGFFLLALLLVFISEVSLNRERRYKHFVRYIEYLEYEEEVKAGLAAPETFADTFHRWGVQNYVTLTFCLILLLLVTAGVIWTCLVLEWSVLDGLYFSLSSLSAGGMYSIPDGSEDYVYGVTAVYAAVGIPVMILTFGFVASSLILPLTYHDQFLSLHGDVTPEEIAGMRLLIERGHERKGSSLFGPRRKQPTSSSSLSQDEARGLLREQETDNKVDDTVDKDKERGGDAGGSSSTDGSARPPERNPSFDSAASFDQGKSLDSMSYVLLMLLRMKLIDNAFASYLLKKHKIYLKEEAELAARGQRSPLQQTPGRGGGTGADNSLSYQQSGLESGSS